MITVTVMFKSFLKSTTGLSTCELHLDDGSTVYDLANALGARFGNTVQEYLIDPESGSVSVLFSCNKRMCTKDHIIHDGDIVSIFPALAGG